MGGGVGRVAALVVVMVMGVLGACSGGDDDSSSPTTAPVDTTEPETTTTAATAAEPAVVATFPLPDAVMSMAVSSGTAWFGGGQSELVGVDLDSLEPRNTGVQGHPLSIGDRTWVFGRSIYEIDAGGSPQSVAESEAAPERILLTGRSVMAVVYDHLVLHEPEVAGFNASLGTAPGLDRLAAVGIVMFATLRESNLVLSFDPANPFVTPEIDLGGQPADLLSYAGAIWVSVPSAGQVARIDPASLAVTTVAVGSGPTVLTSYAGGVWVANTTDGSVSRIDTATLATETVATEPGASGLAVAGNAVWVANTEGDSVTRIDPVSMEATDTIAVGARPGVLFGVGSHLFVQNDFDETMSVIDAGAPGEPPALTVTIDGSAATITGAGPVGDVAGIVEQVLGQPVTDSTSAGPERTPRAVIVRAAAEFVAGGGSQIAAVEDALGAAGFVVDRDHVGVAPTGLTFLETLLDALFADSSVLFEFGSADLVDAARDILERAASLVCFVPFVRFEIAGHTDDVGDDASNQVLSEARANAVGSYLVDSCLPPEQLVVVGYGESQPKADNSTEEGRAQNRRIEFRLLR